MNQVILETMTVFVFPNSPQKRIRQTKVFIKKNCDVIFQLNSHKQ